MAMSCCIEKSGDNEILNIENSLASAKVSLSGGHVISFIPKSDNRERLWLSPLTKTTGEESIRGGIPICWPWFADMYPSDEAGLPAHGFVRNTAWQLQQLSHDNNTTNVVLDIDTSPQPGFPYHAKLTLVLNISDKLKVDLKITNSSDTTFDITTALHTYFKVNDVESIELHGLSGKYVDKTRQMGMFDTPDLYKIAGETDRIHQDNTEHVAIHEESLVTSIEASGHDSHVVWNPGAEETKNVANIPNDAFREFICVETAITSPLSIASGDTHTLSKTIG